MCERGKDEGNTRDICGMSRVPSEYLESASDTARSSGSCRWVRSNLTPPRQPGTVVRELSSHTVVKSATRPCDEAVIVLSQSSMPAPDCALPKTQPSIPTTERPACREGPNSAGIPAVVHCWRWSGGVNERWAQQRGHLRGAAHGCFGRQTWRLL